MESDPSRVRRASWPALPRGKRLYCIGDIHGRLDLLDDVLGRVTADLAAKPTADLLFVFLGDYLDRGPSSAGVVDRLATLSSIVPTIFLKGGHEAVMIDFLWQPLVLPFWKSIGGYPTLLSYGLVPPLQPNERDCFALAESLQEKLPQAHRAFFEGLRLSYSEGDYLFVHAGVDPDRPLDGQDERDLLWVRDKFLTSNRSFDKFIVHGHSPVREPDIRSNRVNIDTGAYATGHLTCLVLEEDARRFL